MKGKKKVKKIVKIVLWSIGAFFAFLLLAFLIHPLWVGSVASSVAESTVEEMTKAGFDIDKLYVNLYTGRVSMEDVELDSLGDVEPEDALKLRSLGLSFSTISMLSDHKKIEEVQIEGLEIYANSDFSNLYAIVDNVNKYLAEQPQTSDDPSNYEIGRIVLKDMRFYWNWNDEGFENIALPDVEILGMSVRPEGTYIKEVTVSNLLLCDDIVFSKARKLDENLDKAPSSKTESSAEQSKSAFVIDKVRFVNTRLRLDRLPEVPLFVPDINDIGKEDESANVLKVISTAVGEASMNSPKLKGLFQDVGETVKGFKFW